jgi:hypothetical protein
MAMTLEDWKDRYYEAECSHREFIAMSGEEHRQEIANMRRDADAAVRQWKAENAALREALTELEAVVTKRNRPRDSERHRDVNEALVKARTVLTDKGHARGGVSGDPGNAPAATAYPVPPGWKLVPVEADDTVLWEIGHAIDYEVRAHAPAPDLATCRRNYLAAWKRILAAMPNPPQQRGG